MVVAWVVRNFHKVTDTHSRRYDTESKGACLLPTVPVDDCMVASCNDSYKRLWSTVMMSTAGGQLRDVAGS